LATVDVEDLDNSKNLATGLFPGVLDEDPQPEEETTGGDGFRTPGSKRKARTSPGAPSLSEEGGEAQGGKRNMEPDKATIRKKKVRPKKICRKAESLIDLSGESSFVDSGEDFEEDEKERGMLKEGNDIDSVDASVGTAITSMEAEDGGSERITTIRERCKKDGVPYI